MLKRRQRQSGTGGGEQRSLDETIQQASQTEAGQGQPAQAESRIGTRFTMRQRIFAFGNDFWITNERGEKVVKVDGKLFRLRDTLKFEDAQGRELYTIKGRIIDIRETMDIKRPNGQRAAVVHNALLTPIRDRWKITIPGGKDLSARGNILHHEYTIQEQGSRMPIAVISKRWLRVRDTYGIEVQSAFDAPLILAITVVIDMMAHN